MELPTQYRRYGGCHKTRGGHSNLVAAAVEGAKQGDREALHFLYVRYADEVQRYVSSFVRDQHEAEDITQCVFLKLMSVIDRYEPRQVPFAAWLRRVTRNVALDHLRGRRATPFEEIQLSDHGQGWLRQEHGSALLAALDTLPDEQREVVIMRHVVGMSPGEIAEAMGRSESSVHGLHHRGRLGLQAELANAGARPLVR